MIDVTVGDASRRADDGRRTLTLVSVAHWVSHFHMLALPIMFPFLKTALDVSYVELGFALTVFAIVSAVTQVPLGYLVDHFGARRLLIAGLVLGGLSFFLLSLFPTYPGLIATAALLGVANSVYHPADYALLAANMDNARMGRAFSIHTFSGYLGGAMTPPIIAPLLSVAGGHGALIVSGALAFVVAALLIALPIPEAAGAARTAQAKTERVSIITPTVLMLTLFFLLLSLALNGISMFGAVALMKGYGEPFAAANITLTAFLTASAVGVLAGGLLADRMTRHHDFSALCVGLNALIVLAISLSHPGTIGLLMTLAVSGFLIGIITPSRDLMVRAAAPEGAAGRTFGIVTSGINISGIIAPVVFGWVMDHDMPRWVFVGTAICMALTIVVALAGRRPAGSQAGLPGRA